MRNWHSAKLNRPDYSTEVKMRASNGVDVIDAYYIGRKDMFVTPDGAKAINTYEYPEWSLL